jgi:sulfur-oxidizing protein SoxA
MRLNALLTMLAGLIWSLQGVAAASIDQGLAIMVNPSLGNCVTCHDIPALRTHPDPKLRLSVQGQFGPSLQGVALRHSTERLRQWVSDARTIKPDTLMPPYGTVQGLNAPAHSRPLLTPADLDAVVMALSSFTSPVGADTPGIAVPPMPSTVEQLQSSDDANPISLYVEQGARAFEGRCRTCHGLKPLAQAVPQFPKLDARLKLINLEDQLVRCRQRDPADQAASLEDPLTLGLSAYLHQEARGLPIEVAVASSPKAAQVWQQHLQNGQRLYQTRMGHVNLSCRQCHDDKQGVAMRSLTITPAWTTNFPLYRISWQGMGSIDRRLRACYSGVQAQVPPAADPRLRELELHLKVRAAGKPIEGPAVKP